MGAPGSGGMFRRFLTCRCRGGAAESGIFTIMSARFAQKRENRFDPFAASRRDLQEAQ
ncbi:hypothetical protein SAMN02982929_00098 [Saccharopolyspora kobensis]|uniref:Uncharacterized protein n=1 Tax=Saccharopolyspora kobensis TaxID=146035 RepID=A0A1H5T1H5_9PSEU|nr:hypothetical protein SAMN02982929_00098 [Saccharopolyspora kobensis]SFC51392.1 hypothetical protein SAMN05216506_101934 [Saccharopolyspora kobensis]